MRIDASRMYETFIDVLQRSGMDHTAAASASRMFIDATVHGKPHHGARHLLNYLDALESGAINGSARPTQHPMGSILRIDADGGLAQYALETYAHHVVTVAREQGVCVCAISNTYTTGELGWFSRFFSRHGFMSLTTTNSPALVALGADGRRAIGTNPIAFGVPHSLTVDQAISEVAYLRVRHAADNGEDLPPGWAVNEHGEPTTDARAAVEGAMLPFGGRKGANLGLITEVLAMLAGGTSSLEVSDNAANNGRPRVGLFALVLNPDAFEHGAVEKISAHLEDLHHNFEVYIPGAHKENRPTPHDLEVDDETWRLILQR